MEKSAQMGTNRTGMDASPFDSKKMIEGAEKFFHTQGSIQSLKALKRERIDDAGSVGSVPIPGTPKGMFKSTMKKMTGHHPETFINKLGERLAFERSGVRIYESFIEKCMSADNEGRELIPIPIERVRQFRDEEAKHFRMLKECLESIGADPTAQTPDADISGVASTGMLKVIADPRTSLSQCLETMLAIELTDNAAWELLIKLAEDMGMDDMARKFTAASDEEDIHLQEIRTWYEDMVRDQAHLGAA